MSVHLNQINLIGRIGNEPEINKTNDNRLIAKFSVATSENWLDKLSNERKERTEWHRIVIYNAKLTELIERRKAELKGVLVYISGKIRYEKWTDQTGQEQKMTQVILDALGQFIILSDKNSDKNSDKMHEEDDSSDLPF